LVQGTPRCTIVGNDFFSIQTVEHLLAALAAYQIDNVRIQLTGPEVPIFDGSSLMFVQMLKEAGCTEQEEEKLIYTLTRPIYCAKDDALLIAQYYSTFVDRDLFDNNIAPCRTFSVYEEVAPLIEKGLLKGGSLENAIVIKNNQVMNPGGLRFPDEMVRHKILDMVGDLFLMGVSFSAHIVAVRSGHCMNNLLAHALFNHFKEGELWS
jgi:UDP-3-O-[3-hydroxymyristoyl] N-acetylglucosamine deacetylase